ncbi:MAG: 6-phosphogluconolactonase, partial [Actinomyces sp.]
MRLHVDADPAAAATRGAGILADAITRAVQERGLARVAISGGSSPWGLFAELAR